MKKRGGKKSGPSASSHSVPHYGGLNPEDALLWHRVTETLKPIDKMAGNNAGFKVETFSSADLEPAAQQEKKSAAVHITAKAKPSANKPPPLNQIEKRLNRRIAKGNANFDARIDLHGMTQTQAHGALLGFLRSSQARGCRVALVITGKGRASDAYDPQRGSHHFSHEAPGVLRRNIRGWLEQEEFRALVSAYAQAHRRHGGDGAIYVQLRRPRYD